MPCPMKNRSLTSRTIDVLRFPLIVGVVLIHSYTSTRGLIQNDLYPGYKFVSYLFSLEIAQIAVPALFFISGYLYFYNPRTTYRYKLHRRVHTLLIPYLFWNLLVLGLYALVELLPGSHQLFSGANPPVTGQTPCQLLSQLWDGGDWEAGNGTPILHQFWYVRNLMMLVVAGPLIGWLIRRAGWVVPVLLLALWMFTPGQALLSGSAAFFTLGCWFSLGRRDFTALLIPRLPALTVAYLVLLCTNMILKDVHYILWLDRIGFIAGTFFVLGLTGWLLRRGLIRDTPWLSCSSFFIFALHDPMLTFVKRIALKLTAPPTDPTLIAVYFLVPALVIVLCLGCYALLKRLAPGLLTLIAR